LPDREGENAIGALPRLRIPSIVMMLLVGHRRHTSCRLLTGSISVSAVLASIAMSHAHASARNGVTIPVSPDTGGVRDTTQDLCQ
jgi:hypothetical protein